MENRQLIEQFYQAFQKGDAPGMASCYHENIVFEDPAFGQLEGPAAAAMWQMLIERSKGDLTITYGDISVEGNRGSARWEARYHFSKSKRPVHNKIHAQFEFRDGRIFRHQDHFDFWKWSSMALGWPGKLLGFTPYLRNKVRNRSRRLLEKYMKSNE